MCLARGPPPPGGVRVLAGDTVPRCRMPFPPGDRVTFNGKECVCQRCSLPASVSSSAHPAQGLWSKWGGAGRGGAGPPRCLGRGLASLGPKQEQPERTAAGQRAGGGLHCSVWGAHAAEPRHRLPPPPRGRSCSYIHLPPSSGPPPPGSLPGGRLPPAHTRLAPTVNSRPPGSPLEEPVGAHRTLGACGRGLHSPGARPVCVRGGRSAHACCVKTQELAPAGLPAAVCLGRGRRAERGRGGSRQALASPSEDGSAGATGGRGDRAGTRPLQGPAQRARCRGAPGPACVLGQGVSFPTAQPAVPAAHFLSRVKCLPPTRLGVHPRVCTWGSPLFPRGSGPQSGVCFRHFPGCMWVWTG